MEATARLKNARISAQKVRLVADQVRGMPVEEAEQLLTFSTKKAAHIVKKVLLSAVANAERLGRLAQQLLERYGLATREVAAAEDWERVATC